MAKEIMKGTEGGPDRRTTSAAGRSVAPGKATRVSRLAGQKRAARCGMAESSEQSVDPTPPPAEGGTADMWMDAAHRGLAAFSEMEEQPTSAHGSEANRHAPVQQARASNVAPGQANGEASHAGESLAARSASKKLLVAWTIDDGPNRAHTKEMKQIGLGNNRVRNVTWYVQRNRINDENIKDLRKIQEDGGEIAIHSFHPRADHAAWFPMGGKASAYSFPYEGKDQQQIMKDLKSFQRYLQKHRIKPKFVRLPGGLYSELVQYGIYLRMDENEASKVARMIIAGGNVASHGPAARKMASDFKILKEALSDLDLLLWGGSGGDATQLAEDPFAISTQSWMAESSGVGGRTDNVTSLVSNARVGKDRGDGVFERIVKTMKKGDTRFLVVLAHDSSREDANEVKRDRRRMERVASRNGISLEYHTMSSLYERATGKDVETLDVRYE